MGYKKNIIVNFITKICKIFLTFGSSILIARLLGPHGKGEIAYWIIFFGLFGNFGHISINNANPYFLKKTNFKRKDVLSTNILFLSIIWVILSIFIFFLNNLKVINFNKILLLEGIFFIIFRLLVVTYRGSFISNEQIVDINKYYLINNFIVFLLAVIFSLTWKLTVSLYITFKLIGILINLFLFYLKSKVPINFKINFFLLNKEFKYGLWIYFSTLFLFLNYRVDQLLIKYYLDSTQLGIYSVGVNLAELVFLIPASVNMALAGRLYNLNEEKKRKLLTSCTIKYTFYLSILLVLIGFFLTPLVKIVYGNNFSPAIPVIKILFVGVIFASIGRISPSYFYTKGPPKIHLLFTFITLLINVILNIFYIQKYGIIGAAISSTIAYSFFGIAYLIYFIKHENFKYNNLFVIKKLEIEAIIKYLKNYSGK